MIKAIALLSPVFVTLFWTIVFLSGKENSVHKSKHYLSTFMLTGFLLYVTHAVFFSELHNIYSYLESLYILTMLSAYPLFYIYLLTLATEKPDFKRQICHFIPAIIFCLFSLLTVLFMNEQERILYVQDSLINKNLGGLNFKTLGGLKGIIFFSSRFTFLIQIVYYVFKGIHLVNTHNERLANYYSNVEGRTLIWAKKLSIAILFIAIASISMVFIGRSYFVRNEVSLLIPSFIFSTIFFIIGLRGNRQVQMKDEFLEPQKSEEIENTEPIKEIISDQLKAQLINLFEIEKIYKQPDLRITLISELLGTNRTYISRLINDEFAMNFNEFVNKYRTFEAKQLLCCSSNSQYTMEHIAEKSGFGSVNSFLRVFKEKEGITPGKFRAENCEKKH